MGAKSIFQVRCPFFRCPFFRSGAHFSGQVVHFSGQVVHFSGQVVHFSGQVPIFQVAFRVSRPERGPKKHPFLIVRCTYGAYRDHTPGLSGAPIGEGYGGRELLRRVM